MGIRLIFSSILVSLFSLFACRNISVDSLSNSFKIKDRIYSLDNCSINNMSAGDFSLFEIDLSCCYIGNPFMPNDLITVRNFVWFSVLSGNSTVISEGEYSFHSNSSKERKSMTFTGTVTTNDIEKEVTGGRLVIEKDQEGFIITFSLNLKDLSKVTGRYTGPVVSSGKLY